MSKKIEIPLLPPLDRITWIALHPAYRVHYEEIKRGGKPRKGNPWGILKKPFPPDEAARNPERFRDCLPGPGMSVAADPRHDPDYDRRMDAIAEGHFGGGSPDVWDYIREDMDLASGILILHIDVTEPWRGVLDREIEARVRFAQKLVGRRSRGVKGLSALYADIVLVARNLDTESPAKIAYALEEEIKKKYGHPYRLLPKGKQGNVREHIRRVIIRAKKFGHLPR
jgi:hypothetical protein